MGNQKLKNGGIGCLILLLVFITIANPVAGIVLIFITLSIWVIKTIMGSNKTSNRRKQVIKTYGKEKGNAILSKRLIIGMTKEMVELSKGTPDYIKKTEKADNRTEKWYWGKYEYRKVSKYKTYAIIVNETLTEFGDIKY